MEKENLYTIKDNIIYLTITKSVETQLINCISTNFDNVIDLMSHYKFLNRLKKVAIYKHNKRVLENYFKLKFYDDELMKLTINKVVDEMKTIYRLKHGMLSIHQAVHLNIINKLNSSLLGETLLRLDLI